MIKKNLVKKYDIKIGLIAILAVFLTITMAHGGGKGHTHVEVSTNKIEIPKDYKDKKNPYWSDLYAIVAGSTIYKEHCANCHGIDGKGDGILAPDMSPKPFNFEDSKHMSEMNSDYLYWRTMEGGKRTPFKSEMPAYKDILSEKEIWQVLSFAHAFSHKHLLEHVKGEDISINENSMKNARTTLSD